MENSRSKHHNIMLRNQSHTSHWNHIELKKPSKKKKHKMTRPNEVKLQLKNPAIKNSTPYERGSKHSSTPQHEKGNKKREKKSSKRMDHKRNWDLEIPQPNHLVSVSIYIVV